MKKIFKKKVSLFGKEFSVFALVAVAMVTLVSAALLPYFGIITGNAVVSQGLLVDGGGYSSDITEGFPSFTSLEQKTFLSLHNLKNDADVDADLEFVRTCKNTSDVDCDSDIATAYQKWVSTSNVATGERPTVIYDDSEATNKYKMWYIDSGKANIQYANSNDGTTWTNVADTGVAGYNVNDCPFVMKENGVYYMINLNAGDAQTFHIYESNDGITGWVDKGVIFTNTALKNGADSKIDNPKLLKTSTGYNMYFQEGSNNKTAHPYYYIEMATTTKTSLSEIADTAFDDFTNPQTILSPETTTAWDDFRVMQPMVIKEGNQYIMMYVGYNESNQVGKIGYAVSSDGISFTKRDVSTQGLDDELGTYAMKPSVVNADGKIVLFYMNSGTTIAKATLTDVLTSGKITVSAGETRGFFIENNFSQMLVPDTYTITTEIDVA